MNRIEITKFPRILGDHPEWERQMSEREYQMARMNTEGMADLFAGVCRPIFRALYGARRFYGR